MKQFKDPFEAAFEEQHDDDDESPTESPVHHDPPGGPADPTSLPQDDYDDDDEDAANDAPSVATGTADASGAKVASKEEEEDEEEEHMDVDLPKFASSSATGDPDKMAKMQAILSQFTVEQMNRYESFRRSGFQKSTMKRLLVGVTGSQKISMPMTIVMSGIAKLFVGELVETARVVMAERKESGPIRPCHVRESYRRLKLEGKLPKRSVPRLFR
ncbi:hypothetical protein MLD38_026472 [Melastoma candidum]|uniref:Uncharacterized protein n=1 Tax=Melastoma candidum TaxID=119954 RepID=A0ACB9NYK0_9MYRT|nr:hypothetical protein MLD38_026472 [Melastoma candidum]